MDFPHCLNWDLFFLPLFVPHSQRTLHCGEAVAESAENEKWIAQLWLRQRVYQPTAPVGNGHEKAFNAIGEYCDLMKVARKEHK